MDVRHIDKRGLLLVRIVYERLALETTSIPFATGVDFAIEGLPREVATNERS